GREAGAPAFGVGAGEDLERADRIEAQELGKEDARDVAKGLHGASVGPDGLGRNDNDPTDPATAAAAVQRPRGTIARCSCTPRSTPWPCSSGRSPSTGM